MRREPPDSEGLQVAIDHQKEVNRDTEGLQHLPTREPGVVYHPNGLWSSVVRLGEEWEGHWQQETTRHNPTQIFQTTTASSSSTTSTSSAPVTSGTTGIVEIPCPGINATVEAYSGSSFAVYCGVDWKGEDEAANRNGTVKDLETNYKYNLEDCMSYFVDYNKNVTPGDDTCMAITYAANLTAVSFLGGNCYLKDKVGTYRNGTAWIMLMSAGIVGG